MRLIKTEIDHMSDVIFWSLIFLVVLSAGIFYHEMKPEPVTLDMIHWTAQERSMIVHGKPYNGPCVINPTEDYEHRFKCGSGE